MRDFFLKLCISISNLLEAMALITWGILFGALVGIVVYHLIIGNII
jgi:hypothetical protein